MDRVGLPPAPRRTGSACSRSEHDTGSREERALQSSVYAVEAEVEGSHWWFRGRRRLVADVIRTLGVPRTAAVLDVGSGTGTNLRLLRELDFRDVTAVDASEDAIRFCDEKGLGPVLQGDICALPCPDDTYDLILATDIIEHIDDDAQALAELHRVLRPGGTAILTVPAFPSLWGLQDRVSHHRRRYRRRELEGRIAQAGLSLRRSFYFNYLLFLPIWLARQCIERFGVELESENQVNTPVLNRILGWIFTLDVRTAPRIHPFFGVSLLALAQREASAETRP